MPDLTDQSNSPSGIAFIPRWVRVVIVLFVLILFLAAAAMLAASLLLPGRENWSEPAAAMAQTASTGLLVLLVLFFVERGQSRAAVGELTEKFFMEDLPFAFEKIEYEAPVFKKWSHRNTESADLKTHAKIKIAHAKTAYRAVYIISVGDAKIRVMVEFNVRRLGVVITLQGQEGETPKSVFDGLKDTINGAKDAGYHIGEYYDATGRSQGRGADLGWERSFSHTFHRNLEENFLYNEAQRQYVAQDLAIMIRAMMSERGLTDYYT